MLYTQDTWRCSGCCERELKDLHARDLVSYSREVGGWYCLWCSCPEQDWYALILRPSGDGPERREHARVK